MKLALSIEPQLLLLFRLLFSSTYCKCVTSCVSVCVWLVKLADTFVPFAVLRHVCLSLFYLLVFFFLSFFCWSFLAAAGSKPVLFVVRFHSFYSSFFCYAFRRRARSNQATWKSCSYLSLWVLCDGFQYGSSSVARRPPTSLPTSGVISRRFFFSIPKLDKARLVPNFLTN